MTNQNNHQGSKEFFNSRPQDFEFSTPSHIEHITSLVSKDGKILDFGCGYGRVLKELSELGYSNLYGIDISEKLIERAESECADINYKCGDNLDIFDTNFDLILFNNVLVNICFDAEQDKVLESAVSKLNSGGKIVIMDFLKSDVPKYKKWYEENLVKYGEDGIYTKDGCLFKHHTTANVERFKSFFNSNDYVEYEVKSLSGNSLTQFVLTGSLE